MANLCVIPARGGSKRIPRKNIKDFDGKPIIGYSIEAALSSGLFDEVMVSTDDSDIANISKKFGAKIPFIRSKEAANDFATTADVIDEVLSCYKNEHNTTFSYVCCIYPCAPFVTVDALRNALELLVKNEFDSVFPVVPFGFPIQRAIRLVDNKSSFIQSQFALSRSQDLEKSYHDAGQFYWLDASMFFKERKLISDNSGVVILSELEVQDIDNEADWQIAELKYKLLKK